MLTCPRRGVRVSSSPECRTTSCVTDAIAILPNDLWINLSHIVRVRRSYTIVTVHMSDGTEVVLDDEQAKVLIEKLAWRKV
jgi:hypothetical protein